MLGEEPGLEWYDKYFLYKGKKLYDLHRMTHIQTEDGHLDYTNYKYADANKAIIKEWRDHALANGYKLEFVLPHPGPSTVYAAQGRDEFLQRIHRLFGFAGHKVLRHNPKELEKREIETDDLYWDYDTHMSNRGNMIVGKILSELM